MRRARVLAQHHMAMDEGNIDSRPELIPGAVGIASLMESDVVDEHIRWMRQKVALNQVGVL